MRNLQLVPALVCLAGLGCATSQIETSWVEPSATPRSFQMHRVLAVALVHDGAIRRSGEDAIAAALSSTPPGQAGRLSVEPSYRLLEDRELLDVGAAREKVEAAGYDGAVLVRFVSAEPSLRGHPTSYHGGFWGDYGYGVVSGSDHVRIDTIVRLEVSIYSLAEDKLLWSGVSRTANPRGIDALIRDVADAVRDDLVDRGLLPPPAA